MKVLALIGLSLVAVAASAASDRRADPNPVTRVVQLLEQLQARLEGDEKQEQAAYDKFACWCEKTTDKKAKEIVALKDRLRATGSSILQLKGTVATLLAELKQLADDIRANEKAQQQLTVIRQKENEAFLAEKAELQQAISALEGAITVLRQAIGASLRQLKSGTALAQWSSALAKVQGAIHQLPERTRPSAGHLLALSKLGSQYTPQSGTVQGILQDMYASFTATLEHETSAEATRQRDYENLMATYQTEVLAMQESIAKKETQKTEAEIMLVEAEDSFAADEEQLKADIEFFDATKAECTAKAQEWSSRKTLRAEELKGITEALNILTSDEARDLFSKAIQPGVGGAAAFLQVAKSRGNDGPRRVQDELQAVARTTRSLRLAAIAAQVGETTRAGAVGHFAKVFVAIDSLLEQLAAEQADDEARVKSCQEQFHKINSTLEDLQWKVENNNAAIDKLGRVIESKGKDVLALETSIADTSASITAMQTSRTEENTAYLAEKGDDEKAIELLQSAVAALKQYYTKHGIDLGPTESGRALLVQQGAEPENANVKPEAKFSHKGHRAGESKGVIALLETIIEDLQQELVDGRKAEETAQVLYEERRASAEKLVKEMTESKVQLESFIALRKQDLDDEKTKLLNNENDIAAQKKLQTDITPSCDFITSRISDRTRKRDAERDALKSAKEYLAGMSPDASGSFLQRRQIAPHV